MKYIVLLCDGMADYPVPELNNKTPMEAANKPAMDSLVPFSELGMMKTVPDGLPAGSDVANLSVIGYNPTICYSGRSPLEAANIGVDMAQTDIALRCNLVTLSNDEPYENKKMVDYCAGDISTEEANELIKTLQNYFGGNTFDFYTGTAYRHCLIWHNGTANLGKITPPHDISGRIIGEYLPTDKAAEPLLKIMKESYQILKDHPVNKARIEKGLSPATSAWFWGQGVKPQLENFEKKYHLKGAMISAVDLLKGIGKLTGMRVENVSGATGYIDTNFKGKKDAAIHALKNGCDYAYIHLEAPDECGHRGEIQNKVLAIEKIDQLILQPLLEEMKSIDDFTLLICPDHPTPLSIRTHVGEPIPYLIYQSNQLRKNSQTTFTEKTASIESKEIRIGHEMLSYMLNC